MGWCTWDLIMCAIAHSEKGKYAYPPPNRKTTPENDKLIEEKQGRKVTKSSDVGILETISNIHTHIHSIAGAPVWMRWHWRDNYSMVLLSFGTTTFIPTGPFFFKKIKNNKYFSHPPDAHFFPFHFLTYYLQQNFL